MRLLTNIPATGQPLFCLVSETAGKKPTADHLGIKLLGRSENGVRIAVNKNEFCIREKLQQLFYSTCIMGILQQQVPLSVIESNILQEKQVILFPLGFFLLTDPLKEMILLKILLVLWEIERVNAAVSGKCTEWLLLFRWFVQG